MSTHSPQIPPQVPVCYAPDTHKRPGPKMPSTRYYIPNLEKLHRSSDPENNQPLVHLRESLMNIMQVDNIQCKLTFRLSSAINSWTIICERVLQAHIQDHHFKDHHQTIKGSSWTMHKHLLSSLFEIKKSKLKNIVKLDILGPSLQHHLQQP